METKLYVGNLSYTTTETDLKALFAKAGQVASVALITDRNTDRPRGFAFVEMNTQVEVEQAINMLHGYSLNGRELKVNLAKPREDRKRISSRQSGRKRR